MSREVDNDALRFIGGVALVATYYSDKSSLSPNAKLYDMKKINFSYNWNNKLDCHSFTTIRLSSKYMIEVYSVF